jgi:hypothetical protein
MRGNVIGKGSSHLMECFFKFHTERTKKKVGKKEWQGDNEKKMQEVG